MEDLAQASPAAGLHQTKIGQELQDLAVTPRPPMSTTAPGISAEIPSAAGPAPTRRHLPHPPQAKLIATHAAPLHLCTVRLFR